MIMMLVRKGWFIDFLLARGTDAGSPVAFVRPNHHPGPGRRLRVSECDFADESPENFRKLIAMGMQI